MPRRILQDDDDVSLFPFLSIICAIIGVLTLMLAAVALGQMNEKNVRETVENAIAFEQIQQELAEVEELVNELSLKIDQDKAKLLSSIQARQSELVKSRSELDELIRQLAETESRIEQQKKVKIVIPEVPKEQRETIADLKAQLDKAKERLATLQANLDVKKRPKEATVSIVPGGSGLSYTPNFVECTAQSIVLHTEDPPLTIRKAEIPANPKFVALLESTANSRNQSIVFLLRSDSLGTYQMVKKLCDENGVRNGKLPAVGHGRIDLKKFRNK